MRKIRFKLKGVLLGTLLVVCLCSCGNRTAYFVEEESAASEESQDEQNTMTDAETEKNEEKLFCVYVCGQVQAPGIYMVSEGSRLYEVFIQAGGFTEEAATDYWNQARLLKDGEMIYVPSKEEVKNHSLEGESGYQTDSSDKVNINTASKEELMSLPGIGETKALAILAYRQEHGAFSTIEELKEVEGIKEAVFAKIKVYIEI